MVIKVPNKGVYYLEFEATQNKSVITSRRIPIYVVTHSGEQYRKYAGTKLFASLVQHAKQKITKNQFITAIQQRCESFLGGRLHSVEITRLLNLVFNKETLTLTDFMKMWTYYFEAEKTLLKANIRQFFCPPVDPITKRLLHHKIIWLICPEESHLQNILINSVASEISSPIGRGLIRFSGNQPQNIAIDYVDETLTLKHAKMNREELVKTNFAEELRERNVLQYVIAEFDDQNDEVLFVHKKITLEHYCVGKQWPELDLKMKSEFIKNYEMWCSWKNDNAIRKRKYEKE